MTRVQMNMPASPAQVAKAAVEHLDMRHEGLLQRPFVQNVLPFITSLSVHAAILILGLLIFGAVKLAHLSPLQSEIVIPDSPFAENNPPTSTPSLGLHSDSLLPPAQDTDLTSTTKGIFDKKGTMDLSSSSSAIEASLIGPGALSAFTRSLSGDVTGTGDPRGPVSMIGGPSHGGTGGHTFIPNTRGVGNARLIVFLCDATGSMINKMATLKDELNKAVVALHPNQSFDIIFYKGVRIEELAPTLIVGTPENKRKAGNYLEGITSSDTTDPIPSLITALKLKPQLLYFLTDAADFPDPPALLDAIKKYNPDNRTKINTILFVENKAEHEKNADSEGFMKKIASDTGGTFRWVEMDQIP